MRPIESALPAQPIACPADPVAGPRAAEPGTFRALLAQRPGAGMPTPAAAGPLRPAEGPAVSKQITDVITQLRRDEKRLERYVRRAMAGQDFELPELVAMQSLVFRYSQRVELLSKLVDRVTGAVKQTLQTQI